MLENIRGNYKIAIFQPCSAWVGNSARWRSVKPHLQVGSSPVALANGARAIRPQTLQRKHNISAVEKRSGKRLNQLTQPPQRYRCGTHDPHLAS